jgi:hypothetical protein
MLGRETVKPVVHERWVSCKLVAFAYLAMLINNAKFAMGCAQGMPAAHVNLNQSMLFLNAS